jgi:molybdopterin-biosynthesis enzyme MoeA-like protein
VSIDHHPQAVKIMAERVAQTGGEMNEARMRMTRIPDGAELVHNKISTAPGFWLGNVIVMAGVPHILQAMLDIVAPRLKTGAKMLSETIRADAKEGDVGTELGKIASDNPGVSIGSYPFFDEKMGPNTNIVVRARDAAKLAQVREEVEAMLRTVKEQLAAAAR